MIGGSKTDRTNGLRPVILRRLRLVISVEYDFGRLMRWRTSVVLQSTTGNDERNGRAQKCQDCVDEDEEEGRERLQAIVIVFAFAFVVRNKSFPRVGAPRGLAVFPCPPHPRPRPPRVWEDARPRRLPLGRAASIILIYILTPKFSGWRARKRARIHYNICTTMNWPSILATAKDEEEGSESRYRCRYGYGREESQHLYMRWLLTEV